MVSQNKLDFDKYYNAKNEANDLLNRKGHMANSQNLKLMDEDFRDIKRQFKEYILRSN